VATADSVAVVALLGCPELEPALRGADLEVWSFERVEELLERARRAQPRACVVGPGLPADQFESVVRQLRRELPFTDVVAWLPGAAPEIVRAVLLCRANDFVLDPDALRLAERIRAILRDQKLLPLILEHEDRKGGAWRFEGLVSRNREMWDLFETCMRTAATAATVLILGETGTGKDLIARAIHRRSGRSGRFVGVDCGAVPESLIDSQLFGHVEGAFTGAVGAKAGLIRHADGGTLFLDEIGNIPLGSQNRLLGTLQNETIRPVGGAEEIRVDVRVIAATSVALETAIERGAFREDLFYRLDVIRLIVPPLRERHEDVIFLFGHFAKELSEQYKIERPRVTAEFLDELCSYDWPGNVRELENFVERLLLTHPGERLVRTHFERLTRTYRGREDEGTRERLSSGPRAAAGSGAVDASRPMADVVDEARERVERAYLESLLRESGGRVVAAARQAQISRRTLLRKLTAYGIDKRTYRP
jgi:DNA-binding NtrC family response regulator